LKADEMRKELYQYLESILVIINSLLGLGHPPRLCANNTY